MGAKSNQERFVVGGISGCMATVVVQPVDLVKTRMQLAGQGTRSLKRIGAIETAKGVIRNEGLLGIYTGLSAALFRQATYTATRMGIYMSLLDYFKGSDGANPSFPVLLGCGLTAGGIGAMVGTPAEVALIRMTGDGRLPVEERRNYKHVFDALTRVAKEEGFLRMWRGCTPTVVRAMVLNAAQLSSYTKAKQVLLGTGYFKEGLGLHIPAASFSALACTIVSLPVDITKTRIQTMRVINGVPEYAGAIDCLTKTIKSEGFFSLWKGFAPYFSRLAPHTILTFLFMESIFRYLHSEKLEKEEDKF